MNTLLYRSLATGIFVLGIPMAADAECVSIAGSVTSEMRAATFVFDGTVVRVDHVAPDGTLTRVDDADLGTLARPEDQYAREHAATIEVHRFWKGDISRTITAYFVWNWDGPAFKVGQRQIVFARRQTEGIRKRFGIDPRTPQRDAWVLPCSGYGGDDESVVKQLGPARKPSFP